MEQFRPTKYTAAAFGSTVVTVAAWPVLEEEVDEPLLVVRVDPIMSVMEGPVDEVAVDAMEVSPHKLG